MSSESSQGVVEEEDILTLARAAGLAIPAEDVALLVGGLNRHLERMESLKVLALEGYEPVLTFDPRWL